jgi:hypothetical protein
VRATFPDSIVFDLETAGLVGTFQAKYTLDDEDTIVLEDAVQVDLAEVVLPTKSITDANPEAKAAASAAAKPPAAVEVARARAATFEAELALM